MNIVKDHKPLRLISSKTISCPLPIRVYINYESFYNPSLTSLTPSIASFFKTGIKLKREISSGSPVQVEIAIPLRGCNLKLEAMLSMIMDLERSLPIIPRSFILTKSYILVCSLYSR